MLKAAHDYGESQLILVLNTKSEPRSCKNLHKWNCLAITHTHTQHIRFQSINIAYTQRATWHKKDAAAGDKQTNKRRRKPNRRWHNS